MIPDHALSKAIRAYNANTGFPAVFPLALEAALETIAADIWDEGYEAGEFYEHNYGNESGTDYPGNPYRASETA